MAMTRCGPIRHLMTLTAAQAAGQAGTWAGYVAALPAALTQPHPAVAVSVIAGFWSAPAVFAQPAGRFADRHGPHRTGTVAWALAAAAATVPVLARPGFHTLLGVLALLALSGTWGVAAGEAAPTWLPGLADPNDGGPWLTAATNLALTIGPLITSSVLAEAGDRAAWALVAGLSAAAALGTLLVPARPPARAPASQGQARMPPAVRRVLALTAGVYLALGVITICEPLYVRRVLHSPLTVYGRLLAVVGLAGLLTALAAHLRPRITCGRWAIPAATATLAAGTALYLNTPLLACAVAGAAVSGTGAALFRMAVRAVIVDAIPPGAHGRAFARWETVQCASSVLPTAFTGTLVTVLGLRWVLGGCTALATTVAAASLRPTGQASRNRHGNRADQRPASPLPGSGHVSQPYRQPGPAQLDLDRFRLPAQHPAQYAGGTSRERY
jgi:hypothetical protein